MIAHNIKEGLTAKYSKVTRSSDAYLSNDSTIDYLVSTPAILSMIIDVSVKMLDSIIPKDYVSVGKDIQLSHDHPTLIGETIELTLTVEKVDKNRIYLDIVGKDYRGICLRGKYERVIVDRNKLNEAAYDRLKI
jgi:predicted thioesterase